MRRVHARTKSGTSRYITWFHSGLGFRLSCHAPLHDPLCRINTADCKSYFEPLSGLKNTSCRFIMRLVKVYEMCVMSALLCSMIRSSAQHWSRMGISKAFCQAKERTYPPNVPIWNVKSQLKNIWWEQHCPRLYTLLATSEYHQMAAANQPRPHQVLAFVASSSTSWPRCTYHRYTLRTTAR